MIHEAWFKAFPQAAQKRLRDAAQTLELKRGQMVYRMGDQPKGIYVVESGLVGLVITGEESGKEHFIRFFRAGDFFGHRSLLLNEAYHASAVVLEPTKLVLNPKEAVVEVLENHPVLYRDIAQALARELGRAEEQHVMILENQILPRTARALVYLKDLHPVHNWTRQEIANFCASTVSTIIKALGELEEMGLVKQDGRSIEILNREALVQLQDNQEN